MSPATHGRSFQGERFRANRPESRTSTRTGRSESPSGSPDTREPRRMLRQKGECRRERFFTGLLTGVAGLLAKILPREYRRQLGGQLPNLLLVLVTRGIVCFF